MGFRDRGPVEQDEIGAKHRDELSAFGGAILVVAAVPSFLRKTISDTDRGQMPPVMRAAHIIDVNGLLTGDSVIGVGSLLASTAQVDEAMYATQEDLRATLARNYDINVVSRDAVFVGDEETAHTYEVFDADIRASHRSFLDYIRENGLTADHAVSLEIVYHSYFNNLMGRRFQNGSMRPAEVKQMLPNGWKDLRLDTANRPDDHQKHMARAAIDARQRVKGLGDVGRTGFGEGLARRNRA